MAVMDITTHLTDVGKRYPLGLLFPGLSGQDSNMYFMYKFKFGRNILEYSYEKTGTGSLIQECVKINGKKVLATGNGQAFTCLAVTEPLDLGKWDSQVSFARYVNAMLDTEDSDSQVFLEFIEFVNKMVHFSSTEGTDGLVFSSGREGYLILFAVLIMALKVLRDFLRKQA